MKFAIKWNFSKTFFKDFVNTFRAINTDCLWKPICCTTQKCIFLNMNTKSCLKEFAIFLKCGAPWKIIATCKVSKNAALQQVFFCHVLRKNIIKNFWFFSKLLYSSPILQVTLHHSNSHGSINHMKDEDVRSNSSW